MRLTKSHIVFFCFLYCFIILSFFGEQIGKATETETHPVIVHIPVNTSVQGKPISIIAKVADKSSLENIVLNVTGWKNNEKLERTLEMRRTIKSGIMQIKILTNNTTVYNGPGTWSDSIGLVNSGEIFNIIGEHRGDERFYHIELSKDTDGWISFDNAEIELVGTSYIATIPAELTNLTRLEYFISAENVNHNKTSTLVYTIDLMKLEGDIVETGEKVVEDKTISEKKGTPFYKSIWFIGGVAAIGAGTTAYFLTSEEKEENGTIKIDVEW